MTIYAFSLIVTRHINSLFSLAQFSRPLLSLSSLSLWPETENGQRGDFKSISSNFHIQTLENGSLTIKDVTEADRASYLCEAGNGVGADLSAVVKLTVHIRAHFKSNFQMLRVTKGHQIKINCEAFGEKPLHLKWLKDGLDLESLTDKKYVSSLPLCIGLFFHCLLCRVNSITHSPPLRFRYTVVSSETTDGLLSELTASSATRWDSGSFICEARNAFGLAKFTSRLLVEEVPDAPDAQVLEVASKSVTLRWSTPFNGNLALTKYIIQWKKDKGKSQGTSTITLVLSAN